MNRTCQSCTYGIYLNIWLLHFVHFFYSGLDQFSEDVLRLCVKYKDQGVVGLDIAGDEEGLDPSDEFMFDPLTIKVKANLFLI